MVRPDWANPNLWRPGPSPARGPWAEHMEQLRNRLCAIPLRASAAFACAQRHTSRIYVHASYPLPHHAGPLWAITRKLPNPIVASTQPSQPRVLGWPAHGLVVVLCAAQRPSQLASIIV